ncbi:MAG: NUDIX hydrolase [Ignavibacteriales bacterium]
MSKVSTRIQVSAGGVAFRKKENRIEVVIVSIGNDHRWQLPKGIINTDESAESAAMREVREEAGVETEMIGAIDKVEYWYYSIDRGERVRFHKFVHFYLLSYKSGDVRDHDREINEVCWVEIDKAYHMLAFKSEKRIAKQAKAMIKGLE